MKYIILWSVISLSLVGWTMGEVKTDSKSYFSEDQGYEGWHYGFEDEDGNYVEYSKYDELSAKWWRDSVDNWKYGFISKWGTFAGREVPVIRSYKVPVSGTAYIDPSSVKLGLNSTDGVTLQIRVNDKQIWPKNFSPYILSKGSLDIPEVTARVKKGDRIHFVVGPNEFGENDWVVWSVKVEID